MAGLPQTALAAVARLDPPTPEQREIAARAEMRRLALMGDNQQLRTRYEEIMRWANPPWDPYSRRLDPRSETAVAARDGENILHADITNPSLDRWAVLQVGAPVILRVKPPYVPPLIEDPNRPEEVAYERKQYELDRAQAQAKATQMENQTNEWVEANDFNRTLLWAVWAKEAFGKAIIRTSYDADAGMPTAELLENPSTVYYGWSKRYGRRRLAWASVVEELDPAEAERRYNIRLPRREDGYIDWGSWSGLVDDGDMDQRPEQTEQRSRYVAAIEYWELNPDGKSVTYAGILGGRVIDGPTVYPWHRVPFHVLENQHIPTYAHGKSTAEVIIPLNAALDDMLDRQHQVIQFESGPRYKGLNMANSGDEVDIPKPFHLLPLKEGEDIAQIDTRVDFFPTQLHSAHLYEAIHRATGLTPIAWGMSPNAQTSGRAMSAEWRAVELPLAARLINLGPEVKAIFSCWWDMAEAYDSKAKTLAEGYRRFEIIWTPLDIRDKTERSADLINQLNANVIDPETVIQELGRENVDEIVARIRSYLTDPVWNPLRYQQLLTLQQLELTIRQQELQVQAMEAQSQAAGAPGGGPGSPATGPSPEALAAQGQNAAGQAAQGVSPGNVALNQPGQHPGGIPVDTSILSQTPLVGGIGNRAIVNPAGGGAPVPTNGQVAR